MWMKWSGNYHQHNYWHLSNILSGKSTLGKTFNSYKSKVPMSNSNVMVGHVPFSASFRGRKLWKIFIGQTSYPAAGLKEGTWESLRQNPKEVSFQRSQYMESGDNSDNPIQMMSKRHEIPARYVHHLCWMVLPITLKLKVLWLDS